MINVLRQFLQRLPESSLKNRLRCFYHNRCERNPFRMYFRRGLFEIHYPDFCLRFHENPFSDLAVEGPGYFYKREIQVGDIVVDAGAYVGALTLLMAARAGRTGHVIAFEPDADNARRLRANVALNGFAPVTVIEQGLWNKTTELAWCDPGTHTARLAEDAHGQTCIRVTGLDEALAKRDITGVNFLKMDVEGAELAALEGAHDTLLRDNVHVAVASYHECGDGITAPHVEAALRNLDYYTETGFPQHRTTWGWR